MLSFTLRRLASVVGVVLFLALAVFALGKVGNADPVRTYIGANASAEQVEQARAELGLDDPLLTQFWNFLTGAVQGDLGISLSTKHAIADDLSTRLPATLELAGWALGFAVILAVVLAAVAALGGKVAAVLRFVFFSAASAPAFLVAMLGVLVFYQAWGLLPASGRTSYGVYDDSTGFYVIDGLLHASPLYAADAIGHLILPAVAAGLAPGVALARVLSDGLGASMSSPFARTARAMGESETTILRRHGLRNASSPALSMLAVQAGLMVSSLVVVEQVFAWNGLGTYLANAIAAGDFNAIAAVSLILGVVYVVLNALVEVALAAVDPRVRLG
ncbi:ABC transporter permease [Demequina sp. NBRC 110057]|uniref:ABC transporter permease n=1 Tax=Demequina sp. NBRC 110057 TaxID=1570346 RepID=UPI000A00BF8C|nr:ABC transporter permease [Demequina sp. NBRC 110057]